MKMLAGSAMELNCSSVDAKAELTTLTCTHTSKSGAVNKHWMARTATLTSVRCVCAG